MIHNENKVYECFAKLVLEECFSERIVPLTLKDKPDLQSENGFLGIEVTIVHPNMENEVLFGKLNRGELRNEENAKETLKNNGAEIIFPGFMTEPPSTYTSTVAGSPLVLVVNAVNNKVAKLNGGDYGDFQNYGLFVYTEMLIDTFNQDDLMRCINEKNCGTKKYSDIYVFSQWGVFLFDMKNQKIIKREYSSQKSLMLKAMDLVACKT